MKVVVNEKYSDLKNFVSSIQERFDSDGILIYDKRNKVKEFRINDRHFVVKRYKVPNFIQRIVYSTYRPSKASRAYNYAEKLRKLGIDTPQEIGYVEVYKCFLFSIGYFISDFCSYPDLSKLKETDSGGKLMEGFIKFLVSLHEKGVAHGDLNLSNVLYSGNDEDGYKYSVIDINRSHFGKMSKRQCINNLVRITHDRALYIDIVGRYAELRGWDRNECVDVAVSMLNKFERRRQLHHLLKK